jgi:hypothetical protein
MSSANERLCAAAGRGDVAEIERLVAAGADPNVNEGTDDWTPLQRAAETGHVAAMAALLAAGARVDGADTIGWTPLMWAAFSNCAAAADALVAAGTDVHRVDKDGNTALACASAFGRLDAARVLLEAGARTDVCRNDGKRPIDVVRALARSLARRGCAIASRRHPAPLPCAGLRQHPRQVQRGRPARAAGAAARREAAYARHACRCAGCCWRRWCAIAGGRCACRCWRRRFCAFTYARRRHGCGGA